MRLCLLCLLLASACTSRPDAAAALLKDVQQGLARRDAQLTQYQFEGSAQDGAERARFEVAFRAPHRLWARLWTDSARTFAYDGKHLYEQTDAEKRFVTYATELSPQARALVLAQTFHAFIPEGFRVPLLPRSGVVARRTAHPRAKEAVELQFSVETRAPESIELTYWLRWPSLDFLGKRTRGSDGSVAEERVEDEHCDEAKKLCLPRKVSRWLDAERQGETVLQRVELSTVLPAEAFTLRPPEGFQSEQRTLVPSEEAAPAGAP